MLDIFRKYKNSVFGLLLTGLCVILMGGFGLGSFSGTGDESLAAKVNDTEIGLDQFYRTRERIESSYQAQFGKNFATFRQFLNLEQQAVDSLINDVVLTAFTDSLNLSASVPQIEESIRNSPFFAQGFSKELYRNYLSALGMTGKQLEESQRKQIVRSQLLDIFSDTLVLSEKETKALISHNNTKKGFHYIQISSADLQSKVDTTNEEKLKNFFDESREAYRLPKTVSYSYIALRPEQFIKDVEITDFDIEQAYSDRRNELTDPAEVLLSEIVINKNADKQEQSALEDIVMGESKPNNDAKKKKADEILERLKAEEDFGKLAKELSEDKTSAPSGGIIGWRKYSALDEETRKAVQNLGKGEHSAVVETKNAFKLFEVAEIKEKRQKPLEEVKATLTEDIKKGLAPTYARATADTLEKELSLAQNSEEFMRIAKEKGFEAKQTEKFLPKTEDPSPEASGLTAEVINFLNGETQTVEVNSNFYVVRILDSKESRLPELHEVKEKVVADFKVKEATLLAKARAEELLQKIKADNISLRELAKKENMNVQEIEAKKKAELTDVFFANSKNKQRALALSTPGIIPEVLPHGDAFFLAELSKIESPDTQSNDEEKNALAKQEKEEAVSRLTTALINKLKANADIWVNPLVIKNSAEDDIPLS